jgi:RNA polymerase sigma-70 factor (ECF subfamily)
VADTTVGFQFECAASIALPSARDEDQALVEGLRAAQESAFEALILRFEQPVYNLVNRLLDNPADAADVVQEVFLKVFRKVGDFRADSSLKTWIYRIAVNEAHNQRRWFVRHRGKEIGFEAESGDGPDAADWLADSGQSPYDVTLDHETQALIEAALTKVSPNYRTALVLREIEGLSYEEIAEILRISLGTVKSRILRGRESLREHLAERFQASPQAKWSLELGAQGSNVV